MWYVGVVSDVEVDVYEWLIVVDVCYVGNMCVLVCKVFIGDWWGVEFISVSWVL